MAVLVPVLIAAVGEGGRREAFTTTGLVLGGGWLLFTLCYGLQHRDVVVQVGTRTLAEVEAGDSIEMPLYELTAVAVVDRARVGPCLRLAHGHRRLVVPCGLLEGNQRLWDLVYHGIRHSVASGAGADERTRRLLALPPPRPPGGAADADRSGGPR
ncbi:hypothetical protein ACFSJS_27445 [Streptomyces desertarenae]|uniref:PH domain-containing protein n=1 Tax=Streptomyces desertarenae TaxID=2666184 RepID=A0ABW4PVC5_9ACTN